MPFCRRLTCTVALGVALVGVVAANTPLSQQETIQAAAAQFDIRDVMIPARDGVKLHTKIYTPKNAMGPLPIIMRRTPYGIEGPAGNFVAYFVRVAVVQGS